MSRRAWSLLIAAALVAALAFLGLTVVRRGGVSQLIQPSLLATEALPELLQRIRNFHRVITREGRKVLEVSATEASYFKNDKAIRIVGPRVVFYEDGERAGEVSADSGTLTLDGTDVLSVTVDGNVLFEIGRLRVRTDNLVYDRATNRIRAPGAASVEAAELSLSGTDMTVDVLERSVVIGSGVKMTLHAKPGGAAAAPARAASQPASQGAKR